MSRFHLFVIPLLGLFLTGCGASPGGDVGSSVGLIGAATAYPVRSDYLVDKMPEAAPPRWFTPGYPPLKSLSLAEKSPDKDLVEGLVSEQKKRNVLDPSKAISTKDRSEFERSMAPIFGTPTAPAIRLPDAAELQKLGVEPKDVKLLPLAESAKAALGLGDATLARGSSVFRRWCMHCHGPTGAGDGSNAPQLQPLPRDCREGGYKFVTTSPEAAGRPLKSDLKRTIRRGLDGSMMVAFTNLSEQEVDEVASYVIFLSVRGESEYQAMKVMIKYNDDFLSVENEVAVQVVRILAAWGRAQAMPFTVPPENSATPEDRLASAARGFTTFNEAGCAACHTNFGRTPVLKFDAWGGMTQPRNLTLGVYRGGRKGEDLYTRLYSGISGAGMPAHKQILEKSPPEDGQPDRIWDMVHFLQVLSDPRMRRTLAEKYQINVE